MPPEPIQPQETPDALADETSAEIGEPCKRCGWKLYYRSEAFVLCYVCFPRHCTLGRFSDEQHTRLRVLFSRTGARLQ